MWLPPLPFRSTSPVTHNTPRRSSPVSKAENLGARTQAAWQTRTPLVRQRRRFRSPAPRVTRTPGDRCFPFPHVVYQGFYQLHALREAGFRRNVERSVLALASLQRRATCQRPSRGRTFDSLSLTGFVMVRCAVTSLIVDQFLQRAAIDDPRQEKNQKNLKIFFSPQRPRTARAQVVIAIADTLAAHLTTRATNAQCTAPSH